jgi:hypothetical protein
MNAMPILRLVLVLVFFPGAVFAQTQSRPKGFLTLPWGASRAEAIDVVRRQGATLPEEDMGDELIEAVGGKFAGQQAVSWRLQFVNGKFASAIVTIQPTEKAGSLYRDLKQNLMAKYGTHAGERKISSGTAEERRQMRALYGEVPPPRGTAVTWKFPPTLQDKNTLSITCETSTAPEESIDAAQSLVTLRYVNETLFAAPKPKTLAGKDAVPAATPKPQRPLTAEDL